MRKALIPMFASLALCGTAAGMIAISTAHAQPAQRTPMMVAQADNPAPPRRGFNRPAPADLGQRFTRLCQDSVARQTGDLAYLETSLSLTASQQSSFQRWKDAKLAIAHRHADICAQQVNERMAQRQANQGQANQGQANQGQANQAGPNQGANRLSPAERMAREEDRLKQRLADIDAERPALEAFYNVLSPDQKTTFERASMRDRGNLMRNRFAFSGGPRGPMGGRMPGAPPEAR